MPEKEHEHGHEHEHEHGHGHEHEYGHGYEYEYEYEGEGEGEGEGGEPKGEGGMGMDWPHIHLLINHFPIILAVMGAVAVVVALITRWRGVWLYAVASLAVMGLSAYPTLFSGEEADDALHDPWYIVRGAIDRHQEAAELAMWIMLGTGVVALYAWWRAVRRETEGRQATPAWLRALVLVGALASLGSVSWASWLGGEIVHGSSILQGQAPAGLPPQPPERPGN